MSSAYIAHYFWDVGVLDSSLINIFLKIYTGADYIFVICLKVDEVWNWGNCWLKHKVRQSLDS